MYIIYKVCFFESGFFRDFFLISRTIRILQPSGSFRAVPDPFRISRALRDFFLIFRIIRILQTIRIFPGLFRPFPNLTGP